MTEYIKKLIEEISKRFTDQKLFEGMPGRFLVLVQELNELEARDFVPASRFEFVSLRRMVRNYVELEESDWYHLNGYLDADFGIEGEMLAWERMGRLFRRFELMEGHGYLPRDRHNIVHAASIVTRQAERLLAGLSKTLDSYVGEASRIRSRDFPFVRGAALRGIVERDYRELMLKLFPTESWKSVVILAGSILEALLHDLLTRDAARIAAAMASPRAPTRQAPRSSAIIKRDLQSAAREDEWKLSNYIDVADGLSLVPSEWKPSVQVVLRDFRNCVHPRRELTLSYQITQGEALQAVGALIKICDHIERNHP